MALSCSCKSPVRTPTAVGRNVTLNGARIKCRQARAAVIGLRKVADCQHRAEAHRNARRRLVNFQYPGATGGADFLSTELQLRRRDRQRTWRGVAVGVGCGWLPSRCEVGVGVDCGGRQSRSELASRLAVPVGVAVARGRRRRAWNRRPHRSGITNQIDVRLVRLEGRWRRSCWCRARSTRRCRSRQCCRPAARA